VQKKKTEISNQQIRVGKGLRGSEIKIKKNHYLLEIELWVYMQLKKKKRGGGEKKKRRFDLWYVGLKILSGWRGGGVGVSKNTATYGRQEERRNRWWTASSIPGD